MLESQITVNRFKVKDHKVQLQSDPIVVEEPLQISLIHAGKQSSYSITMRTPGQDVELTYGLLFTEGVIEKADDIISTSLEAIEGVAQANLINVEISTQIELDLTNNARRYPGYSGCGLCGKTSLQALELKQQRQFRPVNCKLDNRHIKALRALLAKQPLFSQTGGSHVAGLVYENQGVLDFKNSVFFEDVGRHNALDKLIGHELNKNDLTQSGVLLLSGRIGFELVQKAIMAGFSVIVALGAPSHLAIQAANQFGITLIGFAKDKSFNFYTADTRCLEK